MNSDISVVEMIFSWARDSILTKAPFLAVDLQKINFRSDRRTNTPQIRDHVLHIDPDLAQRLFLGNEQIPQWILMHCYAHIKLGHIFPTYPENDSVFDLSCDFLAARLVRELTPDLIPLTMISALNELESEFAQFSLPEDVSCQFRNDSRMMEQLGYYSQRIRCDDHSIFHTAGKTVPHVSGRFHGDAGSKNPFSSGSYKRTHGTSDASHKLDIQLSSGKEYHFAEVLKQYTEPGEDPRPDPDSFQIPLYLYSIDAFSSALIEENEFTERRKLSSFVIAIDTSGSCAETLTRRFLEMTRDILLKEKLFFPRFNLRILQCDNRIRRDTLITNASMFRNYIEDLQIFGGGGTDFRPIFKHIDQLRSNGKLPGLRGILCFSDGLGTFPAAKPEYGTTFVFPSNSPKPVAIPKWVESIYFDE